MSNQERPQPTPTADPNAPVEQNPKPPVVEQPVAPTEPGKGPPDHANKPDEPPGQADKTPEATPKQAPR